MGPEKFKIIRNAVNKRQDVKKGTFKFFLQRGNLKSILKYPASVTLVEPCAMDGITVFRNIVGFLRAFNLKKHGMLNSSGFNTPGLREDKNEANPRIAQMPLCQVPSPPRGWGLGNIRELLCKIGGRNNKHAPSITSFTCRVIPSFPTLSVFGGSQLLGVKCPNSRNWFDWIH